MKLRIRIKKYKKATTSKSEILKTCEMKGLQCIYSFSLGALNIFRNSCNYDKVKFTS